MSEMSREEFERKCVALGQALDSACPEDMCFVVALVPRGGGVFRFFLSNFPEQEGFSLLREFLKSVSPGGKIHTQYMRDRNRH
jgi:hypothetical protein